MRILLIFINLIIYSFIVFILSCTTSQKVEKVVIKKQDIVIKKVDKTFQVKTKEQVKKEIAQDIQKSYNIRTKKYLTSNFQKYTDILFLGSQVYNIDYKDVISIIAIESEWNPRSYGKNKNDTEDFGLCQINSSHLESNYRTAKKILDKYKIKYNINDKFDVSLNIMSAFIYLNNSRNELKKEKDFGWYRWIVSYNVGIRGSKLPTYRIKAKQYWNNFYAVRTQL